MPLLDVSHLSVEFKTNDGIVHAVKDVSFTLEQGQTLAIVGESGSGKSQTAFSIMGLMPRNAVLNGAVRYEGADILGLPEVQMNAYRANEIAMIFQDPMTSLNPYMRISDQMAEVLTHHKGVTKKEAINTAIDMLDAVKIKDARNRITMFPHEFSGGMRQRVMIAMALLCRPKLLIADEPTTALDVTVQAEIMDILQDLRDDFGMGIILITHDLGIVAGSCDDTLVMYSGEVMEHRNTKDLFANPAHIYTKGLLAAVPRLDRDVAELSTISYSSLSNEPKGATHD